MKAFGKCVQILRRETPPSVRKLLKQIAARAMRRVAKLYLEDAPKKYSYYKVVEAGIRT